MPEKIDLSRYKKLEELPAENQSEFQEVPSEGTRAEGFVGKDVILDPDTAREEWVRDQVMRVLEQGYLHAFDQLRPEWMTIPEVHSAVRIGLKKVIEKQDDEKFVFTIAREKNISEEEIHTLAAEVLIENIDKNRDRVSKIVHHYELPREKMRPLVKPKFLEHLRAGDYYWALDEVAGLARSFHLPDFQIAAQEGYLNLIKQAKRDDTRDFKKKFNLSGIFLQSKTVKETAHRAYLDFLRAKNFHRAMEMQSILYEVDREFEKSPETYAVAKEAIVAALESGDRGYYLERFVPRGFLQSPEVLEAAQRGLLVVLENHRIGIALDLVKEYRIPEDFLGSNEVQTRAIDRVVNSMSFHGLDEWSRFIEVFRIPDEVFKNPDVLKKALEMIAEGMTKENLETINKFVQVLHVPTSALRNTIETKYMEALGKGQMNFAVELQKTYRKETDIFNSFEATRAKTEAVLSEIRGGNFYKKDDPFIADLGLPENFFDSVEVQDVIEQKYPKGLNYEELSRLYSTPQVGYELIRSIYSLTNFSYEDDIKAILGSQGPAAFLYLHAIKQSRKWRPNTLSQESVDYLVSVSKKYNVAARNILENIIVHVEDPAGERTVIESYLQGVEIVDFSLYERYRSAFNTGDTESIQQMQETLRATHDAIYRGTISEEMVKDSKYSAVAYHAFPPAMGITKQNYEQIIKSRPDRREHVPATLDSLQYQSFEVKTGRFMLGEDQELDLATWQFLGDVVSKVNESKDAEFNESEAADRIVEMWKARTWNTDESRKFLYEAMYRYHLKHDGGVLPAEYEISRSGLMQYKEFVGDRIKNDLVKSYLQIWQEKHPAEYQDLQKDIADRTKGEQARTFAQLKNRFNDVRRKKGEEKQKAIASLDDFLADFNLSYEQVSAMPNLERLKTVLEAVPVPYEGALTEQNYRTEEYYNSPEFIDAYDTFVAKYNLDELLYRKISSDLVADVNHAMRKEVQKFTFDAEGAAETKSFEFAISKKREHGFAGYNMGVCVAPDEQLWNDPAFMNCIIFDPSTKQAMGGIHFLIREDNLCLPGINPSLEILSSVDTQELYDQMMSYAEKVRAALGLKQVLIPTESSIYSNRSEIQEIIRKKAYTDVTLQNTAAFSHSPYSYEFKKCFVV